MDSHDNKYLGPNLEPLEAGTPRVAWSAAFLTVLRMTQVAKESSLRRVWWPIASASSGRSRLTLKMAVRGTAMYLVLRYTVIMP